MHGRAPKGPNQGGHAAPNSADPKCCGSSPTVNHVFSTPGLGANASGDHVAPIGGKGTVGKPGPAPKPKPIG